MKPIDQAQARDWLATAVAEARAGLAEGGIPIGAALYGADGTVLGRGHNLRVQDDDPSMHAETAAFRNAGRQRSYRGTTMVTTLSPAGTAAVWSGSSGSPGSSSASRPHSMAAMTGSPGTVSRS